MTLFRRGPSSFNVAGIDRDLPLRRIDDCPASIRARSTPAKSNVYLSLPLLLFRLKAARSGLRNPDQLRPARATAVFQQQRSAYAAQYPR